MKFTTTAISFLFATALYADCSVYIPETQFSIGEEKLSLDFKKALGKKSFHEVSETKGSYYQLSLKGSEIEGDLSNYAQAQIRMTNFRDAEVIMVEESVRCIEQTCNYEDFADAFHRAYKKFDVKLQHCQSFFVSILK